MNFSNIDPKNRMNPEAYMPMIIEQERGGERGYDLYSRMLKERVIYLNGVLTEDKASSICTQLMLLERQDAHKDIHLYINSPGGSIYGGLAIMDTMNFIQPKVSTFNMGCSASMGAFLVAAGQPGMRSATENSTLMIHQPLLNGYISDQATDLEIKNTEMRRLKNLLYKHLSKFTGQSLDRIEEDCERDYYLTASQALEYGLIDHIVPSVKS